MPMPGIRFRRSRRLGLPLATAVLVAVGVVLPGQLPTAAAAPNPDPGLSSRVASVLSDSRVRAAQTSAVVLDAATGAEIAHRNGDRLTMPASNTKLVTAAAAMHTLGPDYRFRTEVIRRAEISGSTLTGRIYLKGYGDPTARVSDFSALAAQVRSAGIKTVSGKLVVDSSYFDSVRYNPNWRTSYADDYYAAQISGLTFAPNADLDSGTIWVNYRAGATGRRASITTTPAAARSAIKIRNLTTTARSGSTSISVSRPYGSSTMTIRGRIVKGRSGSRQITVNRPDKVAGAIFRAELKKAGVRVKGGTIVASTPAAGRQTLARDYSIPLSQLLVPFLKLSNNMHAEALTKAMGVARTGKPGSWTNGLAATRAYLVSQGVPASGIQLADGSGLTRKNKISARALGRLLVQVRHESWFADYYAALPVAGNRNRMVGGTLRNRMRSTRAANNGHAKTGSLTGVTALAGYVAGRDGQPYVFAMLSEYSGRSPRPVEDKLVVALADWRRPG